MGRVNSSFGQPDLCSTVIRVAPEGDAGLAKKFVTFFPLPPKAKVGD